MGKLIKFAYVNEHGDFPAVLAHFNLDHTRKGDELRLLCPFHDDTKPSCNITLVATAKAQANTFHCFGCNESGSIIDFVAALEGTSDLREAAQTVASISSCSLAPPRTQKRAEKAEAKKRGKGAKSAAEAEKDDSVKQVGGGPKRAATRDTGADKPTSEVNAPLKFTLTLEPSHPYLTSRVSSETAKAFGLGSLPETSRSMMAGRVCIPIHSDTGELIAYAGRYASDDIPDDEEKYLLPKKFEKMSVLFNLHRVDPASKWIVLVEGFFAAMRLHELGVPVVALMGTAVSEAHIALLEARQTKFVYVMFDADDPGRTATDAAVLFLARSFLTKVIELPDGTEPDTVPVDVLPPGLVVTSTQRDGTVVRTRLQS